jgi:exportin-T
MRVQAVHILVDAWYSILTQYQVTSMEIVNSCLNVIGLYVSWIDVNLIVNDRFIPLLFQYLELPDVR